MVIIKRHPGDYQETSRRLKGHIPTWRFTEHSSVFTAELRRAAITDLVSGIADIVVFLLDHTARFMQAYLFDVLHGRRIRDRFEVSMQ